MGLDINGVQYRHFQVGVPRERYELRPPGRSSLVPGSLVVVNDKLSGSKLDQSCLAEGGDDGSEMLVEQRKQVIVADVAGRHDQQAPGSSPQQVGVSEVAVLADHDPILLVREAVDLLIGRSVPLRQLGGVHGVVSCVCQLTREPLGQLCVDQESHAAPSGVTR